jgi:hypothetical protein
MARQKQGLSLDKIAELIFTEELEDDGDLEEDLEYEVEEEEEDDEEYEIQEVFRAVPGGVPVIIFLP